MCDGGRDQSVLVVGRTRETKENNEVKVKGLRQLGTVYFGFTLSDSAKYLIDKRFA